MIAHVTDEGGSLEIEIVVKEGRGYKMAEGVKKDNREIGYIEIDSIFSPVTIVSIDVENTRVGKMTNWDKLILNVKTDDTVTSEEAFREAVKILVGQYTSFLDLPGHLEAKSATLDEADVVMAEAAEEAKEEKPAKKVKKEKVKKVKK
jgi:DNA-directed RNA polymerase subunit alpha